MSGVKDRGAKSPTARRLAIWKRGFEPIPINGKRPLFSGWQHTDSNEEMIRDWERQRPKDKNTGILTRITPTIDVDILDAKAVEIIEKLIYQRFGERGKLLKRVGKPPKCAFPFQTDEPFTKMLVGFWAADEPEPKELKDVKHRIEILGDGQQVVADGIHPDTKLPYSWTGGEPWTINRGELPVLTKAEADAFLNDAKAALVEAGLNVFKPREKEKTAATSSDGFHPLVVEIATKIWGEPTHVGEEYRFGTHGSKGVNSRTGMWFDFENNVGGGQFDLVKMVSASDVKAEPKTVLKAKPFEWIDPKLIPLREWLYKPHYVRDVLSLLLASGGKGKSSLFITEALAMVSGKPLLGIEPGGKLRVWYWNGEDPEVELQRRFAAAIKHFELSPDDIGDRLFIDSGRTLPIVIAEDEKYGTRICEPVIKELTNTLRENRIEVLIIDPFISCHRVAENDNPAIDRVAKSWSSIAEDVHCSIAAGHHLRKSGGERATVEDGRGAGALRDAARTARTINTMSELEAEKAEIDEHLRGYYFRVDVGKANMTEPQAELKPARYAEWYKFVSVDLGNGGEKIFADGDKVGVVTPWKYPEVDVPKITPFDIARAQSAIKAGGPWRFDQRSKKEPWVGIPIAEALHLDLLNRVEKRAVVDLVKDWLGAGLLRRKAGRDDRDLTSKLGPNP